MLTDTPEDARGGVLCDSRWKLSLMKSIMAVHITPSGGAVRALFACFDFQTARRDCREDDQTLWLSCQLLIHVGFMMFHVRHPMIVDY